MSDAPTLSKSYFLSYSRADQQMAMRFAGDLRERGIAMWVDQLDIRPSEHWDRAIEHAVHECRGLVVMLSPRSVESDNVADEISFAIDHRKSVLPVMIEQCRLPLRITRMQVVDATTSYERALEQCIAVLGGDGPMDSHAANAEAPKPGQSSVPSTEVDRLSVLLTPFLGPISPAVARRESAGAASADDLRQRLAGLIPNDRERADFLRRAQRR